ncbi:hypothetical protein COR50_18535 [Chitinophaga caeni]|uniref:Uncharacterized protein n=1 Tax=Chitinophaga caeni TaxID=2029983 RepID=A0A291QYI6_9BACT|nr:hypothetical protein [Chitinophaga caeni]ATL49005.1 hypothetical protein COR50_18535 [Chitinophaga caeni]
MKNSRPKPSYYIGLIVFFFAGAGFLIAGFNTSPEKMTDGGAMRSSNVYYLLGSAFVLLAFIGLIAGIKMKERNKS